MINLFHEQGRYLESFRVGLFAVALGWLTGALIGDQLAGCLIIVPLVWYAIITIRFPINDIPRCRLRKYNCSLEAMLVIAKSAGLELISYRGKVYSLKPRYSLWSRSAVEIIDQGAQCQAIATRDTLECLDEYVALISKPNICTKQDARNGKACSNS